MKGLPAPALLWRDGEIPGSETFDDIYYAPESGLAECIHVFLEGANLPQAWQGRESFTVFETGFGTGLNFLALWRLWQKHRAPGQQLHFVSVEGFPLSRPDLRRALNSFPELEPLAAKLMAQYPPRLAGYHRIAFPGEGLTLTLLFGEAREMLQSFEGQVDAWFLDGFAPSRNPDMWSEELFQAMACRSAPGASAATFSVAGAIRRELQGAGFELTRRPGFGRKRECLAAKFTGPGDTPTRKPWFAASRPLPHGASVAIIGAGIAGATLAHILTREGFKVIVYDKADVIAADASGNPVGLVNPSFSLADDPIARFREGACLHAVGFYEALGLPSDIWQKSGILQFAKGDAAEKQNRLIAQEGADNPWFEAMDREAAALALGVPVDIGGLLVKQAGFLAPKALCQHLLKSHEVRLGCEVERLLRGPDGWTLLGPGQKALATVDAVVLANAASARLFSETSWLPLIRNRGQVTQLPETAALKGIKRPASFGGYLAPGLGGSGPVLGATYRELAEDSDPDMVLSFKDHAENLKALKQGLGVELGVDEAALSGRVSLRVRTPDRLPIVGPATVAETCRRAYANVRHGNRFEYFPPADYHDGLYFSAGFGSRGFQWAPLAAEILAAEMSGAPQPVAREVLEILHPSRFILRDLRRA